MIIPYCLRIGKDLASFLLSSKWLLVKLMKQNLKINTAHGYCIRRKPFFVLNSGSSIVDGYEIRAKLHDCAVQLRNPESTSSLVECLEHLLAINNLSSPKRNHVHGIACLLSFSDYLITPCASCNMMIYSQQPISLCI